MSVAEISNDELKRVYSETGSVWKTGKLVGLSGQQVHSRLQKIGANNRMNVITDADRAIIRARYEAYASIGKAHLLATEMGRTRHFICRVAGEMGLTNANRERKWLGVWKYIDEAAAREVFEDFLAQSMGMVRYCTKRGFDNLGFAKTMKKYFPSEYENAIELKTPKQSLYRIGRSFEYRVRDLLKAHKFIVTRSPASKSPVDLFAIGRDCVLLVQCKRSGGIGVKEWNILYDLADSVGAIPVLTMMHPSGRGALFFEMTGLKATDGSKKKQPREPIEITHQGFKRVTSEVPL
jgi:Holliday junction resolvase